MATSIVIGVNSYVTLEEASAYYNDRFGYHKWTAELRKKQALISAAQILDLMASWYGAKSSESQALEFPRDGNSAVPDPIKHAQLEIAYNIVDTGSTTTEGESPLTELKAGPVSFKFNPESAKNPLKTNIVVDLIKQYGLCGGNSSTKIVPMGRC